MTEHPDATRLDAFAIGAAENDAETRAHVGGCEACTAYVAGLRAGAAVFAQNEAPRAAEFVAAVRRRERRVARLHVGRWTGGTLSVLALAAGIALFARSRSTGVVPPVDPGTFESQPTRFKGGMQVAVIVEHLGAQTRQTDALALEAGDRIRLEIALDHETRVAAGVLTDDGEWAPLEPPLTLQAGTHYSEQSIAFTDSVPTARVIVGEADAVAQAREGSHPPGVTTIRLGPKAR